MICCMSAWDVRDEAGDRWDDLLTECAIYSAASRQPWSEPPIGDPPALEAGQRGDIDELREAVASGDRLRGERWLARRYRDRDFPRDFFTVATDDFEDLGHKLIIAVNAWRLSQIFPPYPTLRPAIREMTSYRGDARSPVTADVVEKMIANQGDIESAHAVFLYDAALQTKDREIIARVGPASAGHDRLKPVHTQVEPYRLARDCGGYLKSFAVAKRLGDARIVEAAKYNLDHAPSLEDFSFA
ncbi:MAG TPA: hypothetical protein VKU62_02805 [Thermoanaerobaculia bacterium]|nr:hypothetical protein [Thermoanaerobaculia bacterium]